MNGFDIDNTIECFIIKMIGNVIKLFDSQDLLLYFNLECMDIHNKHEETMIRSILLFKRTCYLIHGNNYHIFIIH